MAIIEVQKRPLKTRAVKVEGTRESVAEALTFIGHPPPEVTPDFPGGQAIIDATLDAIIKQGYIKLKTPESGGETQNANIGDYIVEGYTKALGKHYWPVKGDYMEIHYDFL